jgi:hypothetical protein
MKQMSRLLVITMGCCITVAAWSLLRGERVEAAPPGPGQTTPVLARDVDNPGRHRIQFHGNCSMNAGDEGCNVTFPVPSGKLVVIETVSVAETVEAGRKPFAIIQTMEDGINAPYVFATDVYSHDALPRWPYPAMSLTAERDQAAHSHNTSALRRTGPISSSRAIGRPRQHQTLIHPLAPVP